MVTHDKQGATFTDRVVFLKDGQIVHDLDLKESPPDKSRTQEIAAITLDLGL
jgi:ABC-type lipoprotein export system ATPase subunit